MNNKKYLFTFKWIDGNKSANDYIKEWCKKNNIQFRYNGYFELEADVYHHNKYLKFKYKKIDGDLYGVDTI